MTRISADRRAFIDEIRSRPDDDTPRLVYADWLTENGEEERGEFIRVQCEIARRSVDEEKVYPPYQQFGEVVVTSDNLIRLRRREADLWSEMWPKLQLGTGAALPTLGGFAVVPGLPEQMTCKFRRGFVHTVTGTLAAFWEERQQCPTCEGKREHLSAMGNIVDCMRCSSTGRVSGPTAAFVQLVEREPVNLVVVSDKSPYVDQTAWWSFHEGTISRHWLPPSLRVEFVRYHGAIDSHTYDTQVNTVITYPDDQGWIEFDDSESCHRSLSTVLINAALNHVTL